MERKTRLWDIDLLRIFACFFVIFNHTGTSGYSLFVKCDVGSFPFWVYLFISIFCKMAVPLFLSISGALLLNKEESIQTVWKKRISKTVIVLLLISFVYFLVNVFYGRKEFNVGQFITTIYKKPYATAFWYLYAYIAFLMVLPLLRKLVAKMEDKYFWYMAGLAFIFSGLLPVVEYLLFKGEVKLYSHLKPGWIYSNIVLYPCMGYFFHHRFDIKKYEKQLPILWLCNIGLLALSCYATYRHVLVAGMSVSSVPESFHSSFALINCVTIFLSAKWLSASVKISPSLQKAISFIGSTTFGIYLLHCLFTGSRIPLFGKWWDVLHKVLPLNSMLITLLICGIIMAICFALTVLLKQIPGIKKLLS